MQLRKGCRLWWLVLPGVLLDRITKHAASAALAPHGVKTALNGVLSWAYTENRGAAFSILSGKSVLLVLLTIVLISALFIYLLRHPQTRCWNAPVCGASLQADWAICGTGWPMAA